MTSPAALPPPFGRLFWKFFIATWVALALASAVVGGFVWLAHADQRGAARAVDQGPLGRLLVDSAAAVLQHGGRAALTQLLVQSGRDQDPPRPPLYAVDADGRDLLGRQVPARALDAARAAAGNRRAAAREVLIDGAPLLLFVPAPETKGPVAGGEARPPPPEGSPSWAVPLATGLVASVLLSALLAWYFARPIRALNWAFGRAAQGDLAVRVAPSIGPRRDEVADLGRQFDRMVQQIDALLQTQRRLFHDVSHELRSPLARLQVCVGLARRDPAQAARMLDRIEHESERMSELIGELLTLARLESGIDFAGESEPTDVASMLAALVEDSRIEADAKAVTIALDLGNGGLVEAQPQWLRRAFGNVLRNAVQHAPPGSSVDVRLARESDGLQVLIADRGPGLSGEELAAVFEPFVRGRSRSAEGFGLGLAIARRAVQAHGGRIEVVPRDGGGLAVRIVLPA